MDVIEIHVSAGDRLEADQPLLTLESDKAAMEVPSPQAGEVLEILVKVGDKVKTGAEVLKLSASAGVVAPLSSARRSTEASGKPLAIRDRCRRQSLPAAQPAAQNIPVPVESTKVYAGPAVRKLARELGVDLALVQGSGARSA